MIHQRLSDREALPQEMKFPITKSTIRYQAIF